MRITFLMLLLISLTTISPIFHTEKKIAPLTEKRLSQLAPDEKELVWIYLSDKNENAGVNKAAVKKYLSSKTLKRRAKVRSSSQLVDEKDIPVSERYIRTIEDQGIVIRNRSKWFNAVTAWVTRAEADKLTSLGFVTRIELVARFPKKNDENPIDLTESGSLFNKTTVSDFDSAFYGYAYAQLKQIKVPQVHQLGFFGQGVTIAVFDNGFRLMTHEAFESMHIIDTYDFVDKKDNVAPINPNAGFGTHGVNTLSVIGAFKKGKMAGPAYKSDYILARTENDSSETPFEEDNWIAAMEWAEGLGADIISSSLGYINFDSSGALSYDKSVYNWAWMNGDSTRITKAANIGVGMGLVIVNSAGNEGFNSTHNTLSAPADGDSVIAAGAVDASGSRVGFSSVGPTTLGKIKPDVMAMGYAVSMASAISTTGYVLNSGTSFSCPLTAGVCALILSAHPGLTPAQVRWALKMTASRSGNPDNSYGYGIINALDAVNYFGITGIPDTTSTIEEFALYQNYPNPFNSDTRIEFDIFKPGNVTITVYNLLGQKIRTLFNGYRPAGPYYAEWDGRNSTGSAVSSGIYFYRLEAKNYSKTKKMLLVK